MKPAIPFIDSNFKAYIPLILVPLLVYMKSFGFDFSPMDEEWMIIKNQAFLNEWGNIIGSFRHSTGEMYYRPLLFISFIIDNHLSPLSPFVFHVTNVLLHLVCVCLLFQVLQQYKVERSVAFIFALLFSIHPAVVHAVTWIPGRNDVLLAIFMLLAIYFQNNYFDKKKIIYLALHFLFFVCALFTKENAIVLPLVFTFNYLIKQKFTKVFGIGYFSFLFIISVAWFVIRHAIVPNIPEQGTDVLLNMKNMSLSVIIFIGKTILPYQQSVYPTLKNALLLPGIVTITVGLGIVSRFKLKDQKIALLGMFLFLIVLLIPLWYGSSSINREQYESRMYTSLIGLFIFFSQLKIHWDNKITKVILTLLGISYLALTIYRMNAYRSQLSFIERGVEECPDNYFFQFRIADHYYAQKDFNGAVEHYTRAIELQPQKGMFYNNRGNSYTALGNKEAALRDFDSAIVKSNYSPSVYINRCVVLLKFDEIEYAMNELSRLKECCQKMIPPELEREITDKWIALGFNEISEALKKDPNNATLYVNRAKLYYDKGMFKEAVVDLERGCALEPKKESFKKYLEMAKRANEKK